MSLDFPLNNQEKGSIENAKFKELKALIFKGGLPYWISSRNITTDKPSQDEMWLEFIDTTLCLKIYHNGTRYSFNLTRDS